MRNALTLTRGIKIFVLILLGLLLTGLFVWFLTSNLFPISGDFRNNLWGPSNNLLHQKSPYSYRVPDGLNPIWLPMIIGLFFPIGFLPLQWASNLWFILTFLSLFLIVVILARLFCKPSILIMIAILGLAIFPSSVAHFKLGQVSLIICLLLLLVSIYFLRLSPFVIGLFLSFSLTKPQLIVLFIPAFFSIYLREQGWSKLIKVVLFTIMWVAIFCLPLFIFYPNWIPDFIHNLGTNPDWAYPTLYGFLMPLFKSKIWAIAFGGMYMLIGIGISVFTTYRLNNFESLLWCLALTTLFSPVIWSWDFVFLYPLVIYTVFDKTSKLSSRVVIFGYSLSLVLFITMKKFWYTDDKYTIWVPIFLIIILAASYTISFRFPDSKKIENNSP